MTQDESKTALADNLFSLAYFRKERSMLKEAYDTAFAAWQESNAQMIDGLAELTRAEKSAYDSVVQYAVGVGIVEGTKKPHALVSLVNSTELIYDEAKALAWAIEHEMCLTLDRKAFEAVTKTYPLPFVEVKESLKARVASDLSSLLDGEK